MANFRELLVKEVLGNDKYKAVLEKYAPAIAKNPAAKLMGRKTCGEVFDLVVAKGLVTKETAEKIAQEIEKLI